jgi:hypothetical protein
MADLVSGLDVFSSAAGASGAAAGASDASGASSAGMWAAIATTVASVGTSLLTFFVQRKDDKAAAWNSYLDVVASGGTTIGIAKKKDFTNIYFIGGGIALLIISVMALKKD